MGDPAFVAVGIVLIAIAVLYLLLVGQKPEEPK